VSTLKIDRSFVSNMLCDSGDLHIVRAIIGLAEAFGVRTVAEGVETAVHARLLHELGCQNCRDSASRPHAGRGAAGLAGPDCGVRRLTELPG
jgi:predicted signal transduction protein with EAL and GGDEF domain